MQRALLPIVLCRRASTGLPGPREGVPGLPCPCSRTRQGSLLTAMSNPIPQAGFQGPLSTGPSAWSERAPRPYPTTCLCGSCALAASPATVIEILFLSSGCSEGHLWKEAPLSLCSPVSHPHPFRDFQAFPSSSLQPSDGRQQVTKDKGCPEVSQVQGKQGKKDKGGWGSYQGRLPAGGAKLSGVWKTGEDSSK